MRNVFFLLFLFLLSCESKSQEKLDLSKKNISYAVEDEETNWIRVKLHNPNKWGFISKDSVVVIPFEYDFVNPFKNGLAYTENGKEKFFINRRNLRLKGDYEEVRMFSEGLAAVRKNKKWGFIDEKGEQVIPIIYNEIGYFRHNGLCYAMKNEKSGFINKKGEDIIPIIYEDAVSERLDDIVIVKNNGKWAFFNNQGKQLSDFIYNDVFRTDHYDFSRNVSERSLSTFFKNGAALVLKDKKYEFLNEKIEPAFANNKFDSATVFDAFKNSIVKRSGRYGIIKPNGEFKVPLEYDFIEPYDTHHGKYSEYYNARKGKIFDIYNKNLKKIGEALKPIYNDFSISTPTLIYKNINEKYGVVDWEGNILIPFEYDGLSKIDGIPFLIVKKRNFYGIVSSTGQTKIPIKYKEIGEVYDKFDDKKKRDKLLFVADGKIVNINNKTLIDGYTSIIPIYYNHNKLIVSKNNKFGIIDIDNKVLLSLEYDEISNWVEYGPGKKHFIKKNGKYGLIEDETFKILIPPIYNKFFHAQGLIFASKDGKAGILNTNNEELCPFIFDEVKPHKYFGYYNNQNRKFYAKKAKKFYQISVDGKILQEISEKEYIENTKYQNM